jgi:hypothetical protein
MTDEHDLPAQDPAEADALARLERRLQDERPIPSAGFRAMLRQRLTAGSAGTTTVRPRLLWAQVAAYAGSGLALLMVAAAGVLGSGPFST